MKTQRKTTIDARQDTRETTTARSESKSNSSPHSHFIEHLTDMFEKPPRENDLDLQNSKLFYLAAQESILTAKTCNKIEA
jgi:hypothetical protein